MRNIIRSLICSLAISVAMATSATVEMPDGPIPIGRTVHAKVVLNGDHPEHRGLPGHTDRDNQVRFNIPECIQVVNVVRSQIFWVDHEEFGWTITSYKPGADYVINQRVGYPYKPTDPKTGYDVQMGDLYDITLRGMSP